MTGIEFIGLVELLRQLIQRSNEMDGEFFNNFVQPTWDSFKTIHNDYKISISKYAELLVKPEYPVENLVKTIRQDSIATEDIRAELRTMIENMPIQYPAAKGKSDALVDFIFSIERYFNNDNKIRSRINIEKNKKISKDLRTSLSHDFPHGVFTIGNPKKSREHGDVLFIRFPNGPRYSAIIYLSRGGENIDREYALLFFENMFRWLQQGYEDALNNYHSLRTCLLY